MEKKKKKGNRTVHFLRIAKISIQYDDSNKKKKKRIFVFKIRNVIASCLFFLFFFLIIIFLFCHSYTSTRDCVRTSQRAMPQPARKLSDVSLLPDKVSKR